MVSGSCRSATTNETAQGRLIGDLTGLFEGNSIRSHPMAGLTLRLQRTALARRR